METIAMKVFHEDQYFMVIDDFLPESIFQQVYDFVCMRDYKHINTQDKVSRVWRVRDGFPLRSVSSFFKSYEDKSAKEAWEFPVNNIMDEFAESMDSVRERLIPYIGEARQSWNRFSVTSWMYPRGTGLSLHEDSGPYSGAYTFFLNPRWNIHWGGQLMILPEQAAEAINGLSKNSATNYRLIKWADNEAEIAALSDIPVSMSVLPRPNRLVVMSKKAHHLVTTVNDNAGDNLRMSIAGFFELNK
jgi:hypothetical protein